MHWDQEFAMFIMTTLVPTLFSCNNEKLEISNQTFIIIWKAYTSPNPLPPTYPLYALDIVEDYGWPLSNEANETFLTVLTKKSKIGKPLRLTQPTFDFKAFSPRLLKNENIKSVKHVTDQ